MLRECPLSFPECSMTRGTSLQMVLVNQKLGEDLFVGGVVFAPNFRCVAFFSAEIPFDFTKAFLSKSKNPIHEIELLPAWFAIILWSDMTKSCQAVHFIDNESSTICFFL